MTLDILAFGAHPDDVELGCGGIIAKEILAGKKVGIIDLTQGELGTRGSIDIRKQEAEAARKILKVDVREQLFFKDGFFINDSKHQLKIIEILRKYKPKIVLCNAIDDRHIDHSKGSKLVSDACFLSGLVKIDTEQEPHRPDVVYHYIQWKDIEPDVVVDISSVIEIKQKAVMAYSSQFYNPNADEPETPITSKNFLDSVTYRAQNIGRMIGVDYAEGFTCERFVATDYLSNLI